MLRDAEGFDYFWNIPDRFTHVTNNTNFSIISTAASRVVGGKGYQLFISNNTPGGAGVFRPLGVSIGPKVFVNIAMHTNGAFGCPMFTLYDSGSSPQISAVLQPSGQIQFRLGGTNQAIITSALGVNMSTYNSFQIEIVIAPSSTGSIKCYMNGSTSPIINVTGVTTRATANSNVAAYILGESEGWTGVSTNATTIYFDDFLIYDDVGPDFNTLLGDVAVRGYFPIGDGASSDYTPSIVAWATGAKVIGQQCLDSNGNIQEIIVAGNSGGSAPTWNATVGGNTVDSGATWRNKGTPAHYKYVNESEPDGDNSRLASSVAGDKELFTFPTLATGSIIYGIMLMPNSKKDDAGTRIQRGYLKSGASLIDTGVDHALTSNYSYPNVPQVFYRDPLTSALFTVSGYNNAQLGLITNT